MAEKHKENNVTVKHTPLLNLEYKDSVFRFLIGSDKSHALSLVNAITGRNYPPDTEVEYNTIGTMIYMAIRNDVSFVVRDSMYLFEHQASINPNMPLRELLYFARKLNALVEHNMNLYRNVRITIPTPQCYVFCNAKNMTADSEDLRLSDSYRDRSFSTGCEWTVHVLNINRGHNRDLMEACSVLREYSEFVAISREWQQKEPGVAGMDHAIDECIEKGILVKFLKEHRLEVRDMSLEEFNVEEYTDLIREDSFNEGKAEGRAEGRAEGKAEGKAEGRAEGKAEGRAEGKAEGKIEGDLERSIRVARRMHARGDDIAYIADTLEESEEQIAKWLAEASDE